MVGRAPGYTLAPDVSLTAIGTELRRALDWLQNHRTSYNGPIILSGWSAGNHLFALLLDHPVIAAGLAISGVYELGPIRETYLNEQLRLTNEETRALSPLRLAQSTKPLEIAYGTRELPALVESSRELHAKRAALHLPGRLVPAPRA
jgi:arylformamidase